MPVDRGALRARRRAARHQPGRGARAARVAAASATACAASPRSSSTAAPASPPTAWACGRCPRARSSSIGRRMAAFRGISHCYQRPTYADWPYSVFTMAHGRSKEECDAILDAIAEQTGIEEPRDALLVHRVQEDPDALLHGRRSRTGNASTRRVTHLADRYARSAELYARAVRVLPGGVNSPVRAMRSIGRDPIFVERAAGAELTDVDGNTYVDYVCSWGPLIHGHAHPGRARRGRRRRPQRGTTLRRADRGRGRARRGGRAAHAVGRDAAHDLLGHRGVDERDPARARRHRPRDAPQVRRRLPRPRRRPAGRGRLRARHARASPRRPACPRRPPPATVDRALERPRRGRARRSRQHELAAILAEPYPANMGLVPPEPRLPRAAARARRRQRRAARLRRGHHRLPRRARRRPGAHRRPARPDGAWARSSAAGCPPRPTAARAS